ncbi:MAG: hypothetical protein KAT65_02490 [Methanophagales archaeon]|nr:hypothetical protein [Methanophagales archaeon]
MPKKGSTPWNKGQTKYPKLNDAEWLFWKYWVERLSYLQIAVVVGCSNSTVMRALKKLNIPSRSLSEAMIGQCWNKGVKMWEGKKHPRLGKHCSECTKIKISKANKEQVAWNKGKTDIYTEQTKTQMRESHKKLFQDPEFAKRMFNALAKRPTKPEKIWQEIAIDKHSLPFKYTGNGGVVIDGRCPDFIHLTKKIVVEVFGHAYHSPLFAFVDVDYKRTYEGTIKHYKKQGYKCVIFWDWDLLREDAEQFIQSVLKKEGVI